MNYIMKFGEGNSQIDLMLLSFSLQLRLHLVLWRAFPEVAISVGKMQRLVNQSRHRSATQVGFTMRSQIWPESGLDKGIGAGNPLTTSP